MADIWHAIYRQFYTPIAAIGENDIVQTISPLNMYDFFSFFHCHDSFTWSMAHVFNEKNSERIERRHKLHHLWLSSAHILHICRYQSIYLLLGVFKMLLNAFMIKRLRRFWKHLFYSLCRRDFTQIVFTFYPDDLASILIPMVVPLLVAGVYIVKYCLETSRQLKWLESIMACHDYMSKHVTGTTHVVFRSTSDI